MPDPRVIFKILAENAQAKKILKETEGAFGKMGGAVQSAALPAAGALAAIGAGALSTIGAASDVEQAFGALESVFKDQAGAAKDLARGASTDVGLATSEYAQMAAVLAAQLKNLGTAPDAILGKTDDLISMGADLSAQFGGSTADAVAALSSLLRGERDPIERYGVSIKQSTIDAYNLANGVLTAEAASKKAAKANSEATKAHDKLAAAQKSGNPDAIKAAKAAVRVADANLAAADALAAGDLPSKTAADNAATLALLTQQTADAQGKFASESDTAAHAQQVAGAAFEDAKAALGTALLPAVVAVSGAFAELAGWVKENTTVVQIIVGVVAALAAAILIVNVAIAAYGAATAVATAAQWLLNSALLANPIGIVVIAVLALVAGIILLWNNCQTFRDIVTTVFAAAQKIIGAAVGVITGLFNTLVDILEEPFNALWAVVQSVFGLAGALIGLWVRTTTGLFKTIVAGIGVIWGPLEAVLGGPFKALQRIISTVFGAIERIVRDTVGTITGLLDGIAKTISGITSAVDKVNPFMASGAGGQTAPAVAGLRAARAPQARAAGPVTVNVYTTGDSMQAEQAVLRALRRQTRINGGVVPAFGWQTG